MTTDAEGRDRAGRALYEQGQALLPGLGQPPAPDWEELDEAVRERWRHRAERSAAGAPRSDPAHRVSR